MEEKKYILYGAGYVGMQALKYIGTKSVEFFVDSKSKDTSIDGVPIIGPEGLKNIYKEQIVIICSKNPSSISEISIFLENNCIPYSVFNKGCKKVKYEFINRNKKKKKLLIVLAGYKEYLWEDVFNRVKLFVDTETDVCIASSGIKNDDLQRISEMNEWSYLSTQENRVGLIQNLAIKLHPAADLIFKMDEDIFLTKNTLSEMERVYRKVYNEKKYAVGFVAPLLNVNGYGYRRILELTGMIEKYKSRFGIPTYGQGGIFYDEDICRFMWDLTLPLDDFSGFIYSNKLDYSICFHRFSIGCILFSRETWKKMGYLQDAPEGQLGIDEVAFCNWCMEKQFAIIIAEKAYAGHFSFSPQNKAMKEYYDFKKEDFQLKVVE